jgi:hypothetical protein
MAEDAAELGRLIAEQAEDMANDRRRPRWRSGREVPASVALRGHSAGLDGMADPGADVVALAAAAEALDRWSRVIDEDDRRERLPTYPRHLIGAGLAGWRRDHEGAAPDCPVCRSRPLPGASVCLGCCRAGGPLQRFLDRLPAGSVELEEDARERRDRDRDRSESMASRKFAKREARRASKAPATTKTLPRTPVLMAGPNGTTRRVRPGMIPTFERAGWRRCQAG